MGSLLGDFVKGATEGRYSPELQRAIREHRRIDTFTDAHPVVRRSRRRLGGDYHLVRSIMVDLFYDHFLARHWRDFSSLPLREFTAQVYTALEAHVEILPPRLRAALPHMKRHDWLASYRDADNVALALGGVARRLRRPGKLAAGVEALTRNYDGLEADFLEYFPLLRRYVAERRSGLP